MVRFPGEGVLIPTRPPRNEIELYDGGAEYYLLAEASHENYKATYDTLVGN